MTSEQVAKSCVQPKCGSDVVWIDNKNLEHVQARGRGLKIGDFLGNHVSMYGPLLILAMDESEAEVVPTIAIFYVVI